MKTSTIRRSTLAMSLVSILPHLFCCGIPALVAIIALGGTVGLSAAMVSNPLYNVVDAFHTQLIIIAVIGVMVSGVLNLIAYRIDCRAAQCSHTDCTPKKTKSFRVFLISLGLLAVDLAWFSTEELVLGLHHHHHEETTLAQNDADHHDHTHTMAIH